MSAYKYVGGGFAYAVPLRDITAAEFEAMDGRQRRIVLQSGWYEETKDLKLTDLNRDQLNDVAIKHGIADPASFATKADLAAAIEASGGEG